MTNKNPRPAESIAELISASEMTCVLTGAGISTESGIPDFRSPGTGLWSRPVHPRLQENSGLQSGRKKYDPMQLLSTEVMFDDPELFYTESIKILTPMLEAKPNRAHEILAEMEGAKLIQSLTTQNIDGLHYKAGSRNIYEVHGNLRTGRCLTCADETAFSTLLEKTGRGEIPPRCDKCGGMLRTNVVLFGDRLPDCFEDAHYDARTCDLMIVIGSSLAVAPVNMLPPMAKKLAIINIGETESDRHADVLYHEKASVALENIYNVIMNRS